MELPLLSGSENSFAGLKGYGNNNKNERKQ
jgi:hypothetical protein